MRPHQPTGLRHQPNTKTLSIATSMRQQLTSMQEQLKEALVKINLNKAYQNPNNAVDTLVEVLAHIAGRLGPIDNWAEIKKGVQAAVRQDPVENWAEIKKDIQAAGRQGSVDNSAQLIIFIQNGLKSITQAFASAQQTKNNDDDQQNNPGSFRLGG